MGDIVKLGRNEFKPRTPREMLGIREGQANGESNEIPGGNAHIEKKGGMYVDSTTQRPWGARHR